MRPRSAVLVLAIAWMGFLAHAGSSRLEELSTHPDHLIGVELLTAGPLNQNIESQWGHAMLRLVTTDSAFADPVFSFAAQTGHDQPGALNQYYKGLTGAYAVTVAEAYLSDVYQSYALNQLRPLRRTIIPSDALTRARLVQLLSNWEDKKISGHYYFLTRNCVGVLLDLLSGAGINVMMPTNIPTEAPRALAFSLISPYPTVSTFEPMVPVRMLPRLLTDPKVMSFEWTDDEMNQLRVWPTVRLQELAQVLIHPVYASMNRDLMAIIRARPDRISTESLYQVNAFPTPVYQLCTAGACAAEDLKAAIKSTFGDRTAVKNQVQMNGMAILNAMNTYDESLGYENYLKDNPWANTFQRAQDWLRGL